MSDPSGRIVNATTEFDGDGGLTDRNHLRVIHYLSAN